MDDRVSNRPSLRREPLYLQTYNVLKDQLHQGRWQPGELIPAEQSLARTYGVSGGTVRKAIDRLVGEHLLVRRQGKGTFVASVGESGARFRLLRLRDADDQVPRFSRRVLGCRRARAVVEVASKLRVSNGATVIHVRRVLDFNQKPSVFDEIWLPATRFRGLSEAQLSRHTGPIYALFEAEYGTPIVQATERLSATTPSPEAARQLNIRPGHPVLQVDRITRTYDDEPIEFRRSVAVTDAYHYMIDLQ